MSKDKKTAEKSTDQDVSNVSQETENLQSNNEGTVPNVSQENQSAQSNDEETEHNEAFIASFEAFAEDWFADIPQLAAISGTYSPSENDRFHGVDYCLGGVFTRDNWFFWFDKGRFFHAARNVLEPETALETEA